MLQLTCRLLLNTEIIEADTGIIFDEHKLKKFGVPGTKYWRLITIDLSSPVWRRIILYPSPSATAWQGALPVDPLAVRLLTEVVINLGGTMMRQLRFATSYYINLSGGFSRFSHSTSSTKMSIATGENIFGEYFEPQFFVSIRTPLTQFGFIASIDSDLVLFRRLRTKTILITYVTYPVCCTTCH